MTRISVLELVASSRGGGAVHVRDLALGLAKMQARCPAGRDSNTRSGDLDPARFAVQVGMAEDGGNVGREDFAGIPFHPLDIAAGFSLTAIRRLRQLLPDVDILHMHGARAALFGRLAVLSLPRRKRPRVIYSIHGFAAPHYPPPRRQILLAVERALAPVTDLWICVSHAEKDALLAAGVADARRVRVIWNGIDVQRFGATVQPRDVRLTLGLPADSFVVTTICRLFRPRDFPTLLHAFQQVRASVPHAHLLVVGDGPLRPEVEADVAALHLEGAVHLLGMRRDVPRILRATDVLVLSSRGWEGLPLTVLEAMASSLPVIASDVGGTREAVVDGETGLLFAPGDTAALARHILALAADSALAQRMGGRGQARVQEFFTAQRMARETAATYAQLLPTVGRETEIAQGV